jgi:bifunctional non-homologous end joining protein LigD
MSKQIELRYQNGTSDKVYKVSLVQEAEQWSVRYAYGRRGATLTAGYKVRHVPADKAATVYEKLVREKTLKGYQVFQGGEGPIGVPRPTTGKAAWTVQLLESVETREVERYLTDDAWWAQPKLDGRRVTMRVNGSTQAAFNRRGLPIEFNDPTLPLMTAVVDGEAVGERLFVFDLLECNGVSTTTWPYARRLSTLADLGFDLPTARTTTEKRAMLAQLQADSAEGIVFKRHDAPHRDGRHQDWKKYKFYKTVTACVAKLNDRRSVGLFVCDENGTEVSIGNVSIPVNYEVPPLGSCVEVRYLYAFRNSNHLFQPTYLGERDDADDATLDQLEYKAEVS